jgi:hypothetical protein
VQRQEFAMRRKVGSSPTEPVPIVAWNIRSGAV